MDGMGKMDAAVGCDSWAQIRDNLSRKTVRNNNGKKGFKVCCVSSAAVGDPYKTLRIQHGASESEVKKAFRQLALQGNQSKVNEVEYENSSDDENRNGNGFKDELGDDNVFDWGEGDAEEIQGD